MNKRRSSGWLAATVPRQEAILTLEYMEAEPSVALLRGPAGGVEHAVTPAAPLCETQAGTLRCHR